MLTEAEQNLVQRIFARGPAALMEGGYTEAQAKAFLEREDVRAHILLLEREMDHAEKLEARQRRITRRSLDRLSDGAVAVLGQALAGPRYLTVEDEKTKQVQVQRGANGKPIIASPEPTPIQLRAAELILESQGVQKQKGKNDAPSTDVSVEVLFKGDVDKAVEIGDDPAHTEAVQHALARERVRTVIDILAQKVPELHNNLRRNLGLPAPEEEIKPVEAKVRPARKKKTKKKAAKKKTAKKAPRKTAKKKTSGRKTTRKKAPTKR